MLMLQCWRVKKRPTKEERFGVELALKYRRRWDRPFSVFRSGWSSLPLRLLWLVNTRRQASKMESALFHASPVTDARRQRWKRAAERHKPRTLGWAAESCIAADPPLESRRFDAKCAMGLTRAQLLLITGPQTGFTFISLICCILEWHALPLALRSLCDELGKWRVVLISDIGLCLGHSREAFQYVSTTYHAA